MFENILIGIDERAGGHDAVVLAQQLLGAGGKLTLAYVHGGYPVTVRGSNTGFEAIERERAASVLGTVSAETGIQATVSVGSPSVGRGLHELAESVGADLLVVGSTHRGMLGRVLIGDDTRHALNGAPCAVAVAPAGYGDRATAITEVGVGYNESPESRHAVEFARAFAAGRGARVSAFEAVTLPTYFVLGRSDPIVELAEEFVDDARSRIAKLGVEPHASYGDPAEELTFYSASLGLLVIGSRDYGPVGRLVHGSTAQRLARSARCPLLVLTRAARAADEHASDEDLVAVES